MDIEDILVNHFKSSYEDQSPSSVESIPQELQSLHIPQISSQQCSTLTRPVTWSEIEETIFQLGPYKALGSVGIPAFFYQEFWNTIKPNIINFVQDFFHSSSLFKPLNHTYITLVLKIPYPEEVNHFRQTWQNGLEFSNPIQKILNPNPICLTRSKNGLICDLTHVFCGPTDPT